MKGETMINVELVIKVRATNFASVHEVMEAGGIRPLVEGLIDDDGSPGFWSCLDNGIEIIAVTPENDPHN